MGKRLEKVLCTHTQGYANGQQKHENELSLIIHQENKN